MQSLDGTPDVPLFVGGQPLGQGWDGSASTGREEFCTAPVQCGRGALLLEAFFSTVGFCLDTNLSPTEFLPLGITVCFFQPSLLGCIWVLGFVSAMGQYLVSLPTLSVNPILFKSALCSLSESMGREGAREASGRVESQPS